MNIQVKIEFSSLERDREGAARHQALIFTAASELDSSSKYITYKKID